jgi:hypothetical protein
MPTPIQPRWQELTGLNPDDEASLSRDEREEAISILVSEVQQLARVEFARTTKPRTPAWDPIDYICNHLQISRVKLSRYTVELTGLRAHEITDSIKAASLPEAVHAWLEEHFAAVAPDLRQQFAPEAAREPGTLQRAIKWVMKSVREARSGIFGAGWASKLGYANASRVRNACVHAHGISIGELEFRHVRTMVQKFLEALAADFIAMTTIDGMETKEARYEKEPSDRPRLGVIAGNMPGERLSIGGLTDEDMAAVNALLKERESVARK